MIMNDAMPKLDYRREERKSITQRAIYLHV
jgi:hypothetical protein